MYLWDGGSGPEEANETELDPPLYRATTFPEPWNVVLDERGYPLERMLTDCPIQRVELMSKCTR